MRRPPVEPVRPLPYGARKPSAGCLLLTRDSDLQLWHGSRATLTMWCRVLHSTSVIASRFAMNNDDASCVIKTFTYTIKINIFRVSKHFLDAYFADHSWILPTIARDTVAEKKLCADSVVTPVASLITIPDANPRRRSE